MGRRKLVTCASRVVEQYSNSRQDWRTGCFHNILGRSHPTSLKVRVFVVKQSWLWRGLERHGLMTKADVCGLDHHTTEDNFQQIGHRCVVWKQADAGHTAPEQIQSLCIPPLFYFVNGRNPCFTAIERGYEHVS